MIRTLLLILFVLLVVLPIAVLALAMAAEPTVGQHAPSTAEDATRTREIFREFRTFTETEGEQTITLSQSDMNSVLAFATRALPFLRGRAEVTPDAVTVDFSADARRIPGGGWLNLHVAVEPSDTGIKLASVRLGRLNFPPGLVLPATGFALDLMLGDRLGQVAINSIDGVSIDGDQVALGVGLDRAARKALAARAKNTVRAVAGIGTAEDVRTYYLALVSAVEDGRLPRRGSVLPFIRLAMDYAELRASSSGDARAELKSALLGLAIYCGSDKFENVVGDVIPTGRGVRFGCDRTTLGGRVDLRQHFLISAGLKAASDAGIAFTAGEFKELLDSNEGGSGFSFDDLAADRAGIRFATALLAANRGQRDRMIAAMVDEDSVFPSTEGLSAGLTEAEFARDFGDVDSEAYQQVLAEIDRRIDRLALFLPP